MSFVRDEREPSIEGGPAYDDFIARVQAFYAQRGQVSTISDQNLHSLVITSTNTLRPFNRTPFDPRPKVGTRHVDLYALYNRVTGLGGYDAVSDTKSNKLAWRSIGQEFNLGVTNLPALAFNLKSVYYRFLAAFEIVDFHQRIPPPREILEDVSAKGANILGRTLENYRPPPPRNKDRVAESQDVDGSEGDDGGTPRPDRMDLDEPQSLGRGGRNLRQAPPQRVLFQSDMTTRSSRNIPASPTPGSTYPSGTSNGYNSNLPMTLANYEPKQQVPLTLRAVNTPSNNPEAFKVMELARRDAILAKYPASSRQPKGMMLPGTGFTGPSIYIRTLLSLQSGVLEEQEYALHHLVKISHERGDKYRFDGFSGLAEALIEKVLEIGMLLTGKPFHISYQYSNHTNGPDTLDGLYGTPHILEKARSLGSINLYDRMESEDFARRLCLINEAGLVLRNMVMLEENADFIAKYPAMRDLVVILISLSEHSATSELRQYGFDLAEQLSRHVPADPEEPLLQALIALIDDTDRAVVVSSLRSLSRMGTQLGELMPIQSIPISTLTRICDWLLVEDYELRTVCLDLLYRYTVVISNIEELLECLDLEVLIRRIVRLLLHDSKIEGNKATVVSSVEPQQEGPPAVDNSPIANLPVDLVEQLLLFEEPERSSHW
jgi:chromatin structure-remodeling complex subunit RSC9